MARAGSGATLAAGARRACSTSRPSSERSPGRLNLFRLGSRVVIVDFAHNEAGIAAVLDVAEGIAGGAAGRAAPITAIIGTAGDRPDDTLRGIGRIAAQRAQRVAIKETLKYLRGRTAASVVGELMAGIVAGGGGRGRRADLRVRDRGAPGRAERRGRRRAHGGRSNAPRVIVLMCHEERDGCSSCSTDSARAGRRGHGADGARAPAAGPAAASLVLRSPLGAVVIALLLMERRRCAGRSILPNERLPTGLAADHLLLAIDYIVDDPVTDRCLRSACRVAHRGRAAGLERRDLDRRLARR